MAVPRARVIINPQAGRGATRRKWPLIQQLLTQNGLAFDFVFTEKRGHAIELAEKAAKAGCEYLVAVGGDGTVHEVANGILCSGKANSILLGMVSTGTGSDLIRSLGIPHDLANACARLTGSGRLLMDIGSVEYSKKGKPQQRYYLNGAGIGFDASVVRNVESLPKYFGGTIPYLTGVLRTLITYHNVPVSLTLGEKRESMRVLSVIAANGQYLGGGMKVTPEAKLDDGLFDVLIVGNITKFDLLKTFPKVYKGTHLTHPKVRLEKTKQVKIESNEQFLVHADGELLGEGPALFKLHPATVNIVI